MKERKNRFKFRLTVLGVALAFVGLIAAGKTLAWLTQTTPPVVNEFTPLTVKCDVKENFNGTVKKDIQVQNTGTADAYMRVKLLSYRVDAAGNRIGGQAAVPSFTLNSPLWQKHGDFYYYTKPVAPTALTDKLDKTPLTLQSYSDTDGGKLVVEVMAEAIQSTPPQAVGHSWGVSIAEGSVTAYQGS